MRPRWFRLVFETESLLGYRVRATGDTLPGLSLDSPRWQVRHLAVPVVQVAAVQPVVDPAAVWLGRDSGAVGQLGQPGLRLGDRVEHLRAE